MKITKIVCTPIATLTLIGSLIGGANAALVTWTLDSSTTASATMTNGTMVTATVSGGGSLFALSPSSNTDEFGNSFFSDIAGPVSGNGLTVADAQGATITFAFSPTTGGIQSWYSNAVADLSYNTAITALALDEGMLSGSVITNTTPATNNPTTGPGDPSQSAGIISLNNSISSFSITASVEGAQEGIIYGIADQVPEPSSALLIGLGGLSLLVRRKRN